MDNQHRSDSSRLARRRKGGALPGRPGATPDTSGRSPPGRRAAAGISRSFESGVFLLINEYGKDLREFALVQEETSIGRDPYSDIVLEDLGASRSHARIVRREGTCFVEDLGGRNGTAVNGTKLSPSRRYALANGDSIKIGRSVFTLVLRGTGAPTGAIAGAGEEGDDEDSRCLFRLDRIEAGLLVVSPSGQVIRHELDSDRVYVGSAEGNDIVLSDRSVSPEHAEIVYNREGFHVVDRGSSRGTSVDGVGIKLARIANRSYVRFGAVQALFVCRKLGEEMPAPSFRWRDALIEHYPEHKREIQDAFRRCSSQNLDFAEELVSRGIVRPEEWWAAAMRSPHDSGRPRRGWLGRLFRAN